MYIAEIFCRMSPQGFFVEPIGIISQLCSLIKSRFPEIRVAHRPKKLLDQVRDAIRRKHYAYTTEKSYRPLRPVHRPPPSNSRSWSSCGIRCAVPVTTVGRSRHETLRYQLQLCKKGFWGPRFIRERITTRGSTRRQTRPTSTLEKDFLIAPVSGTCRERTRRKMSLPMRHCAAMRLSRSSVRWGVVGRIRPPPQISRALLRPLNLPCNSLR